ncbi:MAG TPA: TetR/AcrR family transcriptional regulator [Ornithinibacter sp.]|nr:TetR/AcrR family transcriptional regulator [Ornithinibacter sp.]
MLAAAVDLVAERGMAGATIEAVAARSGVAKTTIYRQWSHQADLVLDALRGAAPDAPATDTGSLRADLVLLLAGLAGALGSGPAGLLMAALIDAAGRDVDLAELHAEEARRRHGPVLEVLERGLARGELRADVDLDELLDRLAGPVFHRRFVSGLPLDQHFVERVVDTVLAAP